MTSREDRLVLVEALARLPERERAALSVRYLEHWTTKESALMMGVSEGAFTQLLFRARQRLRKECKQIFEKVSGVALLGGSRTLPSSSADRAKRVMFSFEPSISLGDSLIQVANALAALVLATSSALYANPVGGPNHNSHTLSPLSASREAIPESPPRESSVSRPRSPAGSYQEHRGRLHALAGDLGDKAILQPDASAAMPELLDRVSAPSYVAAPHIFLASPLDRAPTLLWPLDPCNATSCPRVAAPRQSGPTMPSPRRKDVSPRPASAARPAHSSPCAPASAPPASKCSDPSPPSRHNRRSGPAKPPRPPGSQKEITSPRKQETTTRKQGHVNPAERRGPPGHREAPPGGSRAPRRGHPHHRSDR